MSLHKTKPHRKTIEVYKEYFPMQNHVFSQVKPKTIIFQVQSSFSRKKHGKTTIFLGKTHGFPWCLVQSQCGSHLLPSLEQPSPSTRPTFRPSNGLTSRWGIKFIPAELCCRARALRRFSTFLEGIWGPRIHIMVNGATKTNKKTVLWSGISYYRCYCCYH